jgi:hypothetical protein
VALVWEIEGPGALAPALVVSCRLIVHLLNQAIDVASCLVVGKACVLEVIIPARRSSQILSDALRYLTLERLEYEN